MKTNATQQEILLVTNSRFANRQWVEKEPDEKTNLSVREQLEQACWNGLIKELLPELDPTRPLEKKLWLWQVRETHSFLELELSDYPAPKEHWSSIDPYAFLESKREN